jgi:tetratricopeptide (TPR) repeat protein
MYRHYDNGENNRQGLLRRRILTVAVIAVIMVIAPIGVTAQESSTGQDDAWDRAVEAMQNNELGRAIPLLEIAISRDPARVEAVRYLAVAMEQTDRQDRAEKVLRDALARAALSSGDKSKVAFDLALLLSRQGDAEDAIEMYSEALRHDSSRVEAYLNRANLKVSTEAYEGAVEDYEYFLALRPDTGQRPQIEEMIALLQESIEAERIAREEAERRRREEEQARRIAEEERRQREEEERRAAEARRQQMLDSVLQSLESADEETTSFEAEDEELRTYDDELDIVD